MNKVRTLILRAPGTNCNVETAFAFEQAGAATNTVHINRLIRGEERLADYQILVVPGGFTYGDDISAGRVLANELRLKLGGEISRFVADGRLILGICNGFQVLVKAGILPGGINGDEASLTIAANDSGRFECRWVHMVVNPLPPCVFTAGMERMELPVAHGEGKFVAEPEALQRLNVVLYYADRDGNQEAGYPHNPNGSMGNVAGICDPSGRIFGLMPHPERYVRGTQHPQWTRMMFREHGDGFRIFTNAVKYAQGL